MSVAAKKQERGRLLSHEETLELLEKAPYGFLVQDHSIYLVQQEDAYTDNLDAALDLGIVMLHFSAVASRWAGQVRWELSPAAPDGLPEGLRSAAVYHM